MTEATWLDAGIPSDAYWPILVARTGDLVQEAYMGEDGPQVILSDASMWQAHKPDLGPGACPDLWQMAKEAFPGPAYVDEDHA